MSKMTCKKHGRRVVYGETFIVHRNGDGSPCHGIDFKSGEMSFFRQDLKGWAKARCEQAELYASSRRSV